MSNVFDRIRGNNLLLLAAVFAVAAYSAGAGAPTAASVGAGGGPSGAAGVFFGGNTQATLGGAALQGTGPLGAVVGPQGGIGGFVQISPGVGLTATQGQIFFSQGLANLGGSAFYAPTLGATISTGFSANLTPFGALTTTAGGRTALTGALFFLSSLGGQGDQGETGTPINTITANSIPAQWVIGRARKAGMLCFLGYTEDVLHQAIVLSEGECDGIEKIFVRDHGEFEFRRVRKEMETRTIQGVEVEVPVVVDDPTSNLLFATEESPFYYTETVRVGSRPRREDEGGSGPVIIEFEAPRSAMEVYEYFKADGTEGEEMVDSVRESQRRLRWTGNHRLTGKSWVYVRSTQPSYNLQSRSDFINRFWQRAPDSSFLMRGIKIRYPGQDTPIWTDNTAAIYYWWLTERRGFSPSIIDTSAFNAAFAKCNEDLSLEGLANFQDEYPRTTKRYTCGGTINASGGVQQVQSQLNLAMAGEIQHWGGRIYIKPGSDELPVATITSDLLVSEPEITIFPDASASYNSISTTLQQSILHNYTQHTTPDLDDEHTIRYQDDPRGLRPGSDSNGLETKDEYIARGGTYIGDEPKKTRSLNLSLVNNPVSAVNNMVITLRQRRSSLGVSFSVMAGDNLELFNIKPGDKVLLDIPEALERNKPFRVQSTSLSPSGVIAFQFTEWNDDLYDDTVVLPPIPERQIPEVVEVDAPEGLNATLMPFVTTQGNVRYTLNISWDSDEHNTAIYINRIGANFVPVWQIRGGNQYSLEVDLDGEYVIEARHINTAGVSSSVSSTTAKILPSDIPVPIPRLETSQVRNGYLRAVFKGVGNRTISGVEMRVSYGADQVSMPTLPAITEDGWNAAQRVAVNAIFPPNPDDDIETFTNFDRNGWYRVFVRYSNAFGALSDIVDIGTHRIVLPAEQAQSFHAHPRFEGELSNYYRWTYDTTDYLISDQPNARTMTNDQWRGVDDLPFGSSPDAYYETSSYDLGSVGDYRLSCDVIIDTIDARNTGAVTYIVYYRNTEEDNWTSVPFTPGTPIDFTGRYVKARVSSAASENNNRIRDLVISVENR